MKLVKIQEYTYRPRYQLYTETGWEGEIWFRHEGTVYVHKLPRLFRFGITRAQIAALDWARNSLTPPVEFVRHQPSVLPERNGFTDPLELRRTYYPKDLTLVEVQCLGEKYPRMIKIYNCRVELYESNSEGTIHRSHNGTYVEEV